MRETYEPARYLLRIDDLCPTVDRKRWHLIRDLINACGIQPILSVVPDNQDPDLVREIPDPNFWNDMRVLEQGGATIALHGLDHGCSSRGRGLIPLHTRSEFAGRSLKEQRQRIRSGIEILRGYGLDPKLFVAPRHGFDRNTLQALRSESIAYLSDGFARTPFLRCGVTWIPQQLWTPVLRKRGLWTLCLHPNTTENIDPWREFFVRHTHRFTSFDQVVECSSTPLGLIERSDAALRLVRILLHRGLR